MAYSKVKGVRDLYPVEKAVQEQVFSKMRSVAERYGFLQVEAPAIETMGLLCAKSGEEIKKQIFTLEKRGNEDLGLRFEYTAGLARMFIARQKSLTKPVKWFSVGRMWRYEQPQAARQREFYQFNVECIGSGKPESDAEVINLAIDALENLGLKGEFIVKINNRKLLEGLLAGIVPKERVEDVIRVIDKKEKISAKEFEEELSFLGKEVVEQIKGLESDLEKIEGYELGSLAGEGLSELKQVLSLVDGPVQFDINTARGLAYYTGTVFEIYDKKQKYRALCGGGRYDSMVELFGGQSTPATGFGMGYSPVLLLLEKKGLLPEIDNRPDYFIACVSGEERKFASGIVKRLRSKGHVVEHDLQGRNLGNQLKHANSLSARKLIVIGPDEKKSGFAKVKDMQSGKESRIEISKL